MRHDGLRPEGKASAVETAEREATLDALLAAGEFAAAATATIRAYGPEILGYLAAMLRNRDWAQDVFAQFCEDLWRGFATFRRECSVRTWCYVLASNASRRFDKEAYRRRVRRLATSEAEKLANEISTSELRHQRGIADRLREQLTPQEQALLILRVDRGLSWDEVSRVLSEDRPLGKDAVKKRFERVKERLRALAEAEKRTPR